MTLAQALRGAYVLSAISFFTFQMLTSFFGNMLPTVQRSTHVGFVLVLAFLAVAMEEGRSSAGRLAFVLLAAASGFGCGYVILMTDQILFQPGLADGIDLVIGSALVLLMLEATRRSVGTPLVILFLIVVAYALLGPYLPHGLQTSGLPWEDMIARLYMTDIGIWGFITGVSASELAAIILFAGFLMALGGVEVMRDAAVAVAGGAVGGAAKVANICSVLFGMISGSSPANAAIVGNFTIPLMKRAGYTPAFAAAVEAAASTFGQLMPPVMGAAAFVLAELVSVPYPEVMLSAALPAVAIYAVIYAALHFYSAAHGLRGLPRAQIREARASLGWRRVASVVLPVGLLIALIADGLTVPLSGGWALLCSAVLYPIFRPEGWHGWRALGTKYLDAVLQGVRTLVGVATLLVVAQAVVTLINATGLAVVISQGIVDLAQTPFLVALVVAVVTLVVGMGLPTTPAYIITAALGGPAIISHGFSELNAHLFIFYFALLSSITPPVCISVFITAGLAGADWLKTAWATLLVSLFKYVLPFIFLYNSAMLAKGEVWQIAITFVATVMAGVLLEAAVFRYMFVRLSIVSVLLMVAIASVLIYGACVASTLTMIIASAVGLAGIALAWRMAPSQRQVTGT